MAIEIEIPEQEYRQLIKMLQLLSPQEIYKATRASAKRAMMAARTEGSRKIRQIYTIKARDINSRITVKSVDNGAEMRIKGSMEGIEKYRSSINGYGVFAMIKKGHGIRVPRSFYISDSYLMRTGPSRYPVKGIYGPSVPQLFGNLEVVEAMQTRGQEMFARRLEHEIMRRLGG